MTLDEVGRGLVADGVEETVNGEVTGGVVSDVSDGEGLEEVAVALAFLGDGLEAESARGFNRCGRVLTCQRTVTLG